MNSPPPTTILEQEEPTELPPNPPHNDPTMLIDFFDPIVKGEDDQGRTLETILKWDDDTLDRTQDYMQTLFPLPEQTEPGGNAPLVTPEVRQAFLERRELRERFIDTYYRILTVYGLHYDVVQDMEDDQDWLGDCEINWVVTDRPDNWDIGSSRWVVPESHHHARITRIIRSLRVLGCKREAQTFHSFIVEDEEIRRIVPKDTRTLWGRACDWALHIPPDPADGILEWLREPASEPEPEPEPEPPSDPLSRKRTVSEVPSLTSPLSKKRTAEDGRIVCSGRTLTGQRTVSGQRIVPGELPVMEEHDYAENSYASSSMEANESETISFERTSSDEHISSE